MPPRKKGAGGKTSPRKANRKTSKKKVGSKNSPAKSKLDEPRFENLIDNISDVLVEVNSEGIVTYVNKRAKGVYGFEPEELVGSEVFNLIHPNDLEEAIEGLAAAISDGHIANIEIRTKHKDGHYITAIASAKVIGEGTNMRIVGLMKDVTESKRILGDLKESEEKFRTIVDNINDAMYIHDFKGNIIDVNQNTCKMLGYKKNEMVGAQLFKFLSKEEAEQFKPRVKELMKKDSLVFEGEHVKKNGEVVPVSISVRVISREGDGILQSFVRDISDLKKTQAALQESQKNYKAVAEAAQDYIYLIEKDYTYSYVNEAAARLLRTSPEKIIGKRIQDIFPEKVSKRQRKNVRKILQTGEEVYEESQYPIGGRDIWLSARLAPVHDGEGNVAKVLGIARDITKRKEAEFALKESEEKFRMIMASSPDAITVSDLAGNITECNDQTLQIHGIAKKEDIMGQSALNFIAPEEREKAISNIEKTLREGSVSNLEYRMLRQDGSSFPGELSANVILDTKGNPISFVAITKDITERKKIEEELRDSETKYSAVVENSNDAIAIVQDGIIKFVNVATAVLTGYSHEELIGREFKGLVAPEYFEMAVERHRDRMAGKKVPSFYEIEIMDKDGNRIPIEVNNSVIIYEGQESTLSIVRDISERKALEETWRSIADNAPDIVIILDRDHNIRYINRIITGHDESDVVGQSQYAFILPEYHDVVKKAINKVIRTGKPRSYSVQGTGPEGKTAWYETQVGPLIEENVITGVVLFVQEVTDRKEAEVALKESEEKYRSLFETSPDSICIIDLDGTIIECNDATTKITGIPLKDLVGQSFMVLHTLFEDDIEKFQMIFAQLLNDEPLDSLELNLIQEGNVRWLESFPTLLKKEGEIYAIQVITRDITGRKAAEMEMRRQLLKFDVENGNVYIIKERIPEQSVEIFKELLEVGYLGHVFSRRSNKHYKARIEKFYDFAWISEKGPKDSVHPDPKAIEDLVDRLPTYQAILLEGVGYLVSKVGFRKTLALIQSMSEIAYLKDHIILLSVDPSAMDEKEMRGIEKETSVVTSQMALGKIPDKLLDILRFVNKENLKAMNPSYSDVEAEQELSKPTVRKRIRELERLGCLRVIEKGRNKYLEITEKGKTYMVI